jgi:hypothetical protein
MMRRVSLGLFSRNSCSPSRATLSTCVRTSLLPSLPFVCPSNCGSRSFTLMIAVSPWRVSSPVIDSLSFSFSTPSLRA